MDQSKKPGKLKIKWPPTSSYETLTQSKDSKNPSIINSYLTSEEVSNTKIATKEAKEQQSIPNIEIKDAAQSYSKSFLIYFITNLSGSRCNVIFNIWRRKLPESE